MTTSTEVALLMDLLGDVRGVVALRGGDVYVAHLAEWTKEPGDIKIGTLRFLALPKAPAVEWSLIIQPRVLRLVHVSESAAKREVGCLGGNQVVQYVIIISVSLDII